VEEMIACSPDILGGTPAFAGTSVPIRTLLTSLEARDRLDDLLADVPSVRRAPAVRVLELAVRALPARV
jgi:uncharacterized protein (DUF433 family)